MAHPRPLFLALCLCLLVVPSLAGGTAAEAGRPFIVIAHPGDAPPLLTRLTLRRIYLGQITRWPSGTVVVAVNGPPRSPVREAFVSWLFPEGAAMVHDHWQSAYYQGRFPPRALASYRAVSLFVARVAGAVGYVPAGLPHPGALAVRVVGEAEEAAAAREEGRRP